MAGRPPTEDEHKRMGQRIQAPNEQAKTLQDTLNANQSQQVKGVIWSESRGNVGNFQPPLPQDSNRTDNRSGNHWARERVLQKVLDAERARGAARGPAQPGQQTKMNTQQAIYAMQTSDRYMQERLFPDTKNVLDKDEKMRQDVESKLSKTKEQDKSQNTPKSQDHSKGKDRDNER